MRYYCVSVFVGTPCIDKLEVDFNFEYPADAKAAAIARLAALKQAKSALDFSNRCYEISEAELRARAVFERKRLKLVRLEEIEKYESVQVIARNSAHACHVAFWASDLGLQREELCRRMGAGHSVDQHEVACKQAGVMPFAGTLSLPEWDLLVSKRAGFQFECHYFADSVLLFRVGFDFSDDGDRDLRSPLSVNRGRSLACAC